MVRPERELKLASGIMAHAPAQSNVLQHCGIFGGQKGLGQIFLVSFPRGIE
jgi:hypothetical protein